MDNRITRRIYEREKHMKKQLQRIIWMVLFLTIALYGCTGGKEGENSITESLPESSTAQKGAQKGGSIVVGIQQDLDSLDPHIADAAGTSEVLFNIFEGLVKPDENGELVPAVASEYKISEDGTIYTFTIREGIKFHNGQPVTIDDVIYSVNRCAGRLEGQTEPLVSAYSVITEVNQVDDKTIELVLAQGDTELIGYLTAAVIPKDYQEQNTAPVGTGPFRFVSYSPQHAFVMEANEEYWGQAPYLDKVEFRIVANTDSAMLGLKSGSIDIYPYLTSDQAAELSNEMNILSGPANIVQALFLNNEAEPFQDIRVRQALCYTVNVQEIMDMIANGYGTKIGTGMFPAFQQYYKEDLKDYYQTDLKKTKELLTEAGYPNGFEMTITVPSNYQFHVDTAQVLAEQLKQVGITAKIELIEWASWLTEIYRGRNYQSTIVGLDAELAPKALLSRYQSDSSKNFINFSDSEYDEVLSLAMNSIDTQEKIKNYQRLQEILTEKAASVYLQDPAKLVAVNKKLAGFTFYPVYVLDMSKVYFETE